MRSCGIGIYGDLYMNILITNDDGIFSEGIAAIVRELSARHNVMVVSPDGERSASGHAITIRRPIRYKKEDIFEGTDAYSISGTPADCIKFGLNFLSKAPVDLVVSGINHGRNIGTDVLYSGTVSAAMEAHINGYKAVAVSYSGREKYDFDFAARFMAGNLHVFCSAQHGLYNINFPECPATDVRGVKITPLGKLRYTDIYEKSTGAEEGYILVNPDFESQENVDCDLNWNRQNYITVTPIMQDLTDHGALKNKLGGFTL